MKNPRTKEEWQKAADTAQALLLIDAARQYGLIRSRRCEDILRRAKERGIQPKQIL